MDAKKKKVMDNIDLIANNIDEVLRYLNDNEGLMPSDAEKFYDLYHSLTGKNKTDKGSVIREWKKMTKKERNKALSHVQIWAEYHYFRGTDREYIKKCYTYLRDKNYEDELDPKIMEELKREKAIIKDFNEGAKIFR